MAGICRFHAVFLGGAL